MKVDESAHARISNYHGARKTALKQLRALESGRDPLWQMREMHFEMSNVKCFERIVETTCAFSGTQIAEIQFWRNVGRTRKRCEETCSAAQESDAGTTRGGKHNGLSIGMLACFQKSLILKPI